MPKFTVAIMYVLLCLHAVRSRTGPHRSHSGAGLTGLVFAHALAEYAPDVAFELYEGATRLEELGAGIGMQPRSWAVMQAIGLEDALLKLAGGGERRGLSPVQLLRGTQG